MSKNFELLSQLGEELTSVEPRPGAAAPRNLNELPTRTVKVTTSEDEDALVQRVFFLSGREAAKSVVFCAVDQHDGSGSLCARVGEILAARTGGRVCLVDASLRSPSLQGRYPEENARAGSSKSLEPGGAPVSVRQIGDSNLWLLSAGSRNAAEASRVSADRLRDQILQVRGQFDYVLISAPPVSLSADAAVLGQLADGVILVVKAGSTRRAAAMKAKESLAASNVRLLGAILSERSYPIPESLYRRL
ncbi:MAG: CpsD/CapB family tyrosine-protein kinase [Acidobacteriia bacterium]|nr:CpsD/CapB family tyrosine-protein kinase [Terriglobia bacterium]